MGQPNTGQPLNTQQHSAPSTSQHPSSAPNLGSSFVELLRQYTPPADSNANGQATNTTSTTTQVQRTIVSPSPATTESPSSAAVAEPMHDSSPAQSITDLLRDVMRRLDDMDRGNTAHFIALDNAQRTCHNRIDDLHSGLRNVDPNVIRARAEQEEFRRTEALRQHDHHVQRIPPLDVDQRRERELQEIREVMETINSKVHQATSTAPEIDRVLRDSQNTPFSKRIARIRVQHTEKIRLPFYAGDTDPSQHLTAFSIAMGRAHFPPDEKDAGLCQLFVETLVGDALTWFSRLETHSIDTYDQLSAAFLRHYSIYIRQGTTDADLWTLTQADDERLRSYLDRFRAIVSKITVSDKAAIQALRNGLRKSAFRADLLLNRPQTIEDALHKGNAFADVEDEEAALTEKYARSKPPPKDKQKDEYREPRQHYDKDYRKPDKDKRGNMFHVSELDQREDDARQKNKSTYRRPGSEYSQEKEGHPHAFCDYHKRHGHSTEDCRHLKNLLYERFSKGEIKVPERRPAQGSYRQRKPEESSRRSPQRDNRLEQHQRNPPESPKRDRDRKRNEDVLPPPPKKRINMIMGGLPSQNDSVRSIKEYERRAPPLSEDRAKAENYTQGSAISFNDEDAEGLDTPHNDPLVVSLHIGDCTVNRVLIDNGSSVDLIFKSTLERMEIHGYKIKPAVRPLTGFAGDTYTTIGTIKLPVYVGRTSRLVKFVVIDKPAIYNVIMGTPWLHDIRGVPSTYHQCLKIPTPRGIYTLYGDQRISRACSITEHKLRKTSEACHLISHAKEDQFAPVEHPKREAAVQECIDPHDPTKTVGIGANLEPAFKNELIDFLRQNVSTFAWETEDMVGIDPMITCHELNVDPTFKPVKQKRRKLGRERAQAVDDEVEKLAKAGSITEVQYPEWLANPVVVKKKNGKWRVCIDFTDLNKACPKDSFPLPSIDRMVEATAGNELLSFMDAFSGYNQILMHPDDREKTAFITNKGTFCYKVMPFGLKNAGATYQLLVNRMFADQIGKTMEVYIDDMLVKSRLAADHIDDLRTCFETLNKYDMKLNPTKCTFAITSGEFLGYVITQRGIEANQAKIDAIRNLPSPKNTREVQRLTGRIAALNRFISRSTDRCLPFYQLLRGNKRFEWDEKCENAFAELKAYLTTPPVLAKPDDGETLYLYVAVTNAAVSGVLVKEDRGEQKPIFYVSKALDGAEARYPTLEKLALAVVTAARKLRPYFQSHSVVVLTSQPLRTILHSPTQSGRLAKWAVELSEYDIEYKNRTSAKSQVLADFLVELAPDQELPPTPAPQIWTLHVDGSSSQHGSGIGIHLRSPAGEILEQSFRLGFKASNNEAEYEAILAGLRLAKAIGVEHIHAHCDSQLVTHQFSGDYGTRNDRMEAYLAALNKLTKDFKGFELIKIPRSENAPADALASLASTSDPSLKRIIPVECIQKPSIPTDVVFLVEVPDGDLEDGPEFHEPYQNEAEAAAANWQTEIKLYLNDGELPADKWAARRLKIKAARYTMLRDQLYRWSASRALLRCVDAREAYGILRETHEGAGGNHSGGRALALKIRRQGFFWPTLVSDCEKYAARCELCQRHGRLIHVPSELLRTAVTPYPFMRWGMDIVGPLPTSRQKRFLLVMTDYFTKWVEAAAYKKILAEDVIKFVWKNIICRHGLPYEIITDNGPQFISKAFDQFCSKWNIRVNRSTPRYPQGNGQAEASNKIILDGLKKRLEGKKGLWADELDGVLWSYRTTPRRSHGQTPFSLSHGIEALSPAEAGVQGARRTILTQDVELNSNMIRDHLDQVEELRDQALLRLQNYQHLAAQYYNKHVKDRRFAEGDLVYRKVFENTAEENAGKLGANWEGPYQVSKVVKPGVYELMTMNGVPVERSWNSYNLKRYNF